MHASNKSLSQFYRSLWQTFLVFIIFTITFFIYVQSEKAIDNALKLRIESHLLADELRQTSDDLTRMARSYVTTGNQIYKRHFEEIISIRNGKSPRPIEYNNVYWDLVGKNDQRPRPNSNQSISILELMPRNGFTDAELAKLSDAIKHSDALTHIENKAMALVTSNPVQAAQLLQNEAYYRAKAIIMQPISEVHEMVDKRTLDTVHAAESTATQMRIVFILFGVLLLVMIWRASRALHSTLGGSLDQLNSCIAQLGSGNFTSPIPVAKGLHNSVLAWLSETQINLFQIDTERKEAENALRENREHLQAIIENEPECVKLVDREGKLIEINPAGLAMLQAGTLEEAQQHTLESYILPEWRAPFTALHEEVMNGNNGILEFEVQGLKGKRRWLETHAVPMRDADGRTTMLLGITRDVTQRRQSEERIKYLANYDALTGLPNRVKLDEQLTYLLNLAKRKQNNFSLMFIDIDNFKDINDTLGHNIGDSLLVELAKRIRSILREEDTLARLGGDEFILLLPNSDADGAQEVAQKLLHTIQHPFSIEHHELNVTTSIGIALYPTDGLDKETLSKNADAAMYRAKREGRNGCAFFTEEMQTVSIRKFQLTNALHHALSRNELHIVYQPQVSLITGHIIGAEALLRWHHPEFGAVTPAEFIPIAESCGLILSIGEWVLRTAVDQLKSWTDSGMPPMIMAVNLSAAQFRHPNLPDLVTQILESTGLPAEYLELELTEGVAMYNPLEAINIMNNLHERGIRMSIDDFGTGYSSLSYLKKFKVYKLKIDQSFVRDIGIDPEDRAIVSAIINMAHSLGLHTIAEGVETLEQLDYLRGKGCGEIQGYYFSRPLPPEQFEDIYRSEEYIEPNIWIPSI